MQQAQQLLAGADQAIPADFLGDGGISKHAPAQDGQGGLMDQGVVMGDARKQKTQHPAGHGGPLVALRLGQHGAQGVQRGAGRPERALVNQIVQVVQPFQKLLVRHLADEAA